MYFEKLDWINSINVWIKKLTKRNKAVNFISELLKAALFVVRGRGLACELGYEFQV